MEVKPTADVWTSVFKLTRMLMVTFPVVSLDGPSGHEVEDRGWTGCELEQLFFFFYIFLCGVATETNRTDKQSIKTHLLSSINRSLLLGRGRWGWGHACPLFWELIGSP